MPDTFLGAALCCPGRPRGTSRRRIALGLVRLHGQFIAVARRAVQAHARVSFALFSSLTVFGVVAAAHHLVALDKCYAVLDVLFKVSFEKYVKQPLPLLGHVSVSTDRRWPTLLDVLNS